MTTKNLFPTFYKLKTGAYSYVWTEECDRLLPKHYMARCLEYMERDPLPIHWKPDPRKWTVDEYGTRLPVQNHPVQVRYPTQCNKGLWGGEGIVFCDVKSFKKNRYAPRVPKVYRPFLTQRALYSEILDKWFAIPVTRRTLDLIDEVFGFDYYILKTHERDLNSKLGMNLKRELLVALAKGNVWPNNAEKQKEVLKRYQECMIPLEEAEYIGLSIEEALKKAKVTAPPPVPLKDIFKQQLLEQLHEENIIKGKGPEKRKKDLSKILETATSMKSPFQTKES